jgi:hypothetical protein
MAFSTASLEDNELYEDIKHIYSIKCNFKNTGSEDERDKKKIM